MYWEQIAFCLFSAGYIMLSTVKTIDKYLILHREKKRLKTNQQEEKNEKVMTQPQKPINFTIKYIKLLINYSAAFNNRFEFIFFLKKSLKRSF
jgi:hypothetical protein